MMPKISIVIPIYNEEKYIKECILSIMQSDYDITQMELLLVDGMSNDGTREIIRQLHQEYACIELIDNHRKTVPVAMNMGIKRARGEYIIRLDAHADYPSNYLSQLVYWHMRLSADNIGTAIVTEVKNKNKKSNAIKAVLSHSLGVGNSDFRTGIDNVQEVDTVPFGCYKREVFKKYGFYNEKLIRNQDIELNKRIINGGGKIYLIPGVQATYYARENFTDLAKNNYANGYWNILTAYYTKKLSSLSLRHFIPLLFVLSLVLPLIGALWFPKIVWISIFSLVSYLSLVIIISLKLKTHTTSLGALIKSFLTLHLSYGLGSLMGLFKVCIFYIKGQK